MTARRDHVDGEYPAWWRRLVWQPWDIELEPVQREHTAQVRRALTAEIARWLAVGTRDEMRAGTAVWAAESADLASARRAYRYLIRRGGQFAGAIEVRPDALRGHIGYWLRRGARGEGTVTLANRLVLLIGFEGLTLKSIDWVADERNAASIAVMTRLGAEFVDRYPVEDPARQAEVRYRVMRRRYKPDSTGPKNLRSLLTLVR
jgi:RimJ/RimL family protein N-acetyltransferase